MTSGVLMHNRHFTADHSMRSQAKVAVRVAELSASGWSTQRLYAAILWSVTVLAAAQIVGH